ncbi:DUF2752 domain-containing protein [Pedobacter sp. UYP30]|uniref:DUF2752 domain-containing protein n=1 Tax=Pedobacter sp. UYP30 TaxID=1756400 RepID=UPI0033999F9D
MSISIQWLCSSINFIGWLQSHLLSCPFKALTGIDCPGCGFQRSVIALCEGHFLESWFLYPATLPLILLFGYAGYRTKFPVKNDALFLRVLMLFVGNFILICYVYKMVG